MPASYVVDTSALGKRFLDEANADAFRTWWIDTLLTGVAVYAPTLLRYELGNVIQRAFTADPAEKRRIWRESLVGVQWDDAAAPEAFEFPELTFYDAAYLSLARARAAELLTYDDRMAKAAQRVGVAVRSPGKPG